MTYKVINDAKDDLNIVLYEILHNKRPSEKSLSQLEYMKEMLEKESNDKNIDHDDLIELGQTIDLINDVLNVYQTKKDKMSSIKIRETTKIRLNKIAPTYDAAITKLLNLDENKLEDQIIEIRRDIRNMIDNEEELNKYFEDIDDKLALCLNILGRDVYD